MPEVPKCDTDTKWAIAVRRMMAMTWSIQGCHKPTICLKRKKKKRQYLLSTIKQSTIEQGMYACTLVNIKQQSVSVEVLNLCWGVCVRVNHIQTKP